MFNPQLFRKKTMKDNQYTLDVALEFHRRMAAIVSTVQTGIWEAGRHDLLGFDSDFGFGQERGVQTLTLRTSHRSTYLRLHWDAVLGVTPADKALVDRAVTGAINALA